MHTLLKKITIGVIITLASGLLLSSSVNAATLEDAKEAVASGKGKVVHPKMGRKLTDEEKNHIKIRLMK